jgi:hypothetical protein
MTTRKYPRTMQEAFPNTVEVVEGPYSKHRNADFWVYITLAFAAGFLVSHLWS